MDLPHGPRAAGHLLQCEVLSAMRNPLAGRSSASVEKLALLVRPRGSETRAALVAPKETPLGPWRVTRSLPKQPLPKESEEKNVALRLGLTDWRGIIDVPPDELPLRLIYVKNGTHLIARLPVVPGYLPQLSIHCPATTNGWRPRPLSREWRVRSWIWSLDAKSWRLAFDDASSKGSSMKHANCSRRSSRFKPKTIWK